MRGEEWKKVDYFLSFKRKEGVKFFIMTEVESAEKTRLNVSFQLNAGISVAVLVFNWAEVRRDSLEMPPIKSQTCPRTALAISISAFSTSSESSSIVITMFLRSGMMAKRYLTYSGIIDR